MTTAPTPFAGRHAFVSAAAHGIGRATAEKLADLGAHVLAADIDAAALAGLDHPLIDRAVLDVTDADALAATLGRMPRIDILVNCVGWVPGGSILDCGEDEWGRAFEINVLPVYRAIRLALPRMLAAGGGSIVNIASVAGLRGAPQRAAYSATKAAVIGLTRSVSADFAGRGVRCNAICPAMVDSPSLAARIAAMPDPAAARAAFIARHPVGRLGRPEEVAAAVAYLASDESAFTTGTTLVLDGGSG
jgi:2-keto-3-deoxy-L-fuconate dehydrogenase